MDNKNLIYIFLAVFILLSVGFVSGTAISITSPTGGAIINGTFNFSTSELSSADGISCVVFYYSFNNASWTRFNTFKNASNANLSFFASNATSIIGDCIACSINVTGFSDSTSNCGTAVAQNSTTRAVDIDNTAPSITLEVPGNDTWNISNSVYFAFKVTEQHPMWCNLTIGGANNKSNASAISNNTRFTYAVTTIGDAASYLWNVRCRDYPGAWIFASANFTIKVDATAPTGEITMPRVITINAQNPIKIKCGGEDTTSLLHYVRLKVTKPSGKVVEYSLDNEEEKIFQGIETGEAGKNKVGCTIYDLAGNSYDTEEKSFTVYHRSIKGGEEVVTPEEEVTPEEKETTTPTEGAPVEGGEAPSKAWIWIVIGVVVIGVIYFVLKKKR